MAAAARSAAQSLGDEAKINIATPKQASPATNQPTPPRKAREPVGASSLALPSPDITVPHRNAPVVRTLPLARDTRRATNIAEAHYATDNDAGISCAISILCWPCPYGDHSLLGVLCAFAGAAS